ncbi:unnamed protein product [Rotaria socialis]|uniref:F-box domain-containing protein n=3 Tax=Rotaria socialis TaxID=392032 RepID=A0A817SCE3_9BILA|nr:unnamed protein product [Rotaria socialis]CAF4549173.1 unnamed protein product [Rotaria socialis]
MNRSNVRLLDLPDEILLIILKKLNNIDVLYSLLDVNNGRLDILAQENTFTNILKFPHRYTYALIDRFCIDILPRIHHNVKCFITHPFCMKRILLAIDYPNLTELKIFHFHEGTVLNYFTDKSSLRPIFQEQITNLILVNNDQDGMISSLKTYTTNVYSHILIFFKNLKNLSIIQPSVLTYYPGLSLCDLPSTTFSSSILTHLYINVKTFDDCVYLLDGRLRKLTTLYVNVYAIDKSSGIVQNTDKLFNLKCFTLKSLFRFEQYDNIVSLLRRMSYLEKLTLYLRIESRNRVIDGTYVQHDILDNMPQLDSFTFYICTYVDMVGLSYKLSSEDIQQTFRQQHVTSIVNYINGDIAACSIFSLPFRFDYLEDLGNKFPNIVFSYVVFLLLEDINPFKHEFFARIARSFPLLKYLRIFNKKSSILHDGMTLSSDNCQLYSSIEYPHLTRLDVRYAHRDYVEQFLNETKTYMPSLTELGVVVSHLKYVTKDFKREETRRNCAKVKKLLTLEPLVCSKDFWLYFPSSYK